MTIKDLQKDVHKNAVEHGFYEKEPSFGEVISLMHSELSEALEEYRSGKRPNVTYYKCKENANVARVCTTVCSECRHGKPEGIPSELADCIIRILDTAEFYGIDMEAAILEKHEYNKSRPFKHGGKVI